MNLIFLDIDGVLNTFHFALKGQKNKYKSSSVINRNNKILNKIKNDIALINFQQELNQIHKLHNYKIFLNSERAYINNSIKKNNERENGLDYNENKNKKRIDDLKKKKMKTKLLIKISKN